MTTNEHTGASDAEFQARIAEDDAEHVVAEDWEQRIRAVARAMSDEDGLYRFTMAYWRRLAAAALTADAALAGQHTTGEETDRG